MKLNNKGQFILRSILLLSLLTFSLYVLSQSHIAVNPCKNSGPDLISKQKCWDKEMDKTIKAGDVNDVWKLYQQFYDSDKDFMKYCHDFTHKIGQAAYFQFKNRKDITSIKDSSYCGYGFYHGLMEASIGSSNDLKAVQEFCEYIDKQELKKGIPSPKATQACYHGIGHGWFDIQKISSQSDIYMINDAIKLCEKVAHKEMYLKTCVGGVFNSLSSAYEQHEKGFYMKKGSPFFICNNLEKQIYKDNCYSQMTSAYYETMKLNQNELIKLIESIPEASAAQLAILQYSYLYLTREIVIDKNPKSAISFCRLIPERFHNTCIEGLVIGLFVRGKPEFEYTEAINFCSNKLLSEKEKRGCFQKTLDRSIQMYDSKKFNKIYDNIKKIYKDIKPNIAT